MQVNFYMQFIQLYCKYSMAKKMHFLKSNIPSFLLKYEYYDKDTLTCVNATVQ